MEGRLHNQVQVVRHPHKWSERCQWTLESSGIVMWRMKRSVRELEQIGTSVVDTIVKVGNKSDSPVHSQFLAQSVGVGGVGSRPAGSFCYSRSTFAPIQSLPERVLSFSHPSV